MQGLTAPVPATLLGLRNLTMLPDASRDRPKRSIVTTVVLSLAPAVLSFALLASPPAGRVLLVVPPGADLAAVIIAEVKAICIGIGLLFLDMRKKPEERTVAA